VRRELPDLPPDTDLLEWLLSLPRDLRLEAVARLGPAEAASVDCDWPTWAHDGQRPPDGDWRVWVLMAGRGFGKTLAGARWIAAAVEAAGRRTADPLRIALVGATLDDARRVMVEGRSGLLAVADHLIAAWHPNRRLLKFRGGAEAALFSGATPELLRGPEHHLAWCDELAKWEKPGESWDMLQLGLRLGEAPRVLVTTTPRPGPVLRRIMASPHCAVTGGATSANPHTPDAFKDNVYALYSGTRLGAQELEGKLLPDAPGALWTVELIERCRLSGRSGTSTRDAGAGNTVRPEPVEGLYFASATKEQERASTMMGPPTHRPGDGAAPSSARTGSLPPNPHESTAFVRLVIAVDPPSGAGTCGIIACARDGEGRAHVLADHSVTARTPEGWARAVADAALIWSEPFTLSLSKGPITLSLSKGAEPVTIVAESNQGGLMVQSVLRIADPALRVKLVTATQGKTDRAAPVAMLFEAGKVILHGRFPELEAELCGMIAGGDYEGPGNSPDRADAMVWGLTELMLQKERAAPQIRQL
jgi:phage terminase large subunit-like protein